MMRLRAISVQLGRLPFLRKRHDHKKSWTRHCLQYDQLGPQMRIQTYCAEAGERFVSGMEGKRDRHKGFHIDIDSLPQNITVEGFDDLLKVSMQQWQDAGYQTAWLKVPILLSSFIPIAAKHGFVFHHAENNSSSLYCWLDARLNNKVPQFATHQVGVAGCVVREETGEVLMIQDRNRPYTIWKFPGGVSELAEDISLTAEREVFEETGLKTEFQGIIAFRQQHNQPGAFGRSDLFFVCHMTPLTLDLHPDYDHEIAKCQWMKINTVLDNPETSNFTRQNCLLLRHGLNRGFREIHFDYRHMESVYKGLKFNMFFSNLPTETQGDKSS